MIRTVDTDVVVLAVAFQQQINCKELWLAYGTGQHCRYSAHDLAMSLGPDRALALPLFHAFTGCDTVSAFTGRGKKTCWEVWNAYPEVTAAFKELCQQPSDISATSLELCERFVVLLYDRTSSCDRVDLARKKIYSRKHTIESIPPTQDALIQHIRRAIYQAGYIWNQTLIPQPVLPSPDSWGWLPDGVGWKPLWMTLPDTFSSCEELKKCGCKTGCTTKRCTCFRDGLDCTVLCACDGECRQEA